MAASKLPLEIEQGATFLKRITWKAGGIPVDLTGCTARAQMRASITGATVLLLLTTANGRITLGGAAGTIDLEVDAATTAGISWRKAVYDLEIVFPNGRVRRLVQGPVTVSPEVTRDD